MPNTGMQGSPSSFHGMLDEEVVKYAKGGSPGATEHLLSKYRTIVEGKARSYFLIGADHEDIVQEGMIGLYKAIRDFRNDKMLPFRAFAELCISRQIFTAIKAATRQKHIPLNSYVSLHATLFDSDSDRTLLQWSKRYAEEHYRPVGLVEVLTPDSTAYTWSDTVSVEAARTPNLVMVYRRKPGA